MTVVSLSGKRNRVYVRRFDYEDARRRFGAGESALALAAEYGVSNSRIYQVVNPEHGARTARLSAEWMRNGKCDRCGERCSAYSRHCTACSAIARTTSVRDGELQCSTCHEWKPDAAFPKGGPRCAHRRHRHKHCTACQTKAKREYRRRNHGAS